MAVRGVGAPHYQSRPMPGSPATNHPPARRLNGPSRRQETGTLTEQEPRPSGAPGIVSRTGAMQEGAGATIFTHSAVPALNQLLRPF